MKPLIDLDAVLEELYAIDPEFRSQGAALRALAERLLASKPEAEIDEAFVARLRNELHARASLRASGNPFFSFFTMSRNKYLVPGLAVLAIAAAGALTLNSLGLPSRTEQASVSRLASATGIERVGSGAFGPLTVGVNGTRTQSGGGGQGLGAAPAAAPMGGGGGLNAETKMIAPDWNPVVYTYVYKGDAIDGLQESVDVYRRERGAPASVAALLNQGLGLMDLGRSKNASVQSFSIAEDRPNGYVITVNAEEGTINMYENYLKWSFPERSCTDDACIQSYRLKESDMISDAEAIRIAEAFLAEYGVSKEGYGAPSVRDDWRVMYARAENKADYWFPDTIVVTYPTIIDGHPVYDEGGAPYGLAVNVNVRQKRAAGLWNLSTRNFQVSAYAGETDAKRLIGFAERGGVYGDVWEPENATKIEVELGTPTIAYARVWQWNGNAGSELAVPSLVFPVTNAPKDFWRTNVTIPLAQELLQGLPSGAPIPVDTPVLLK